MLPQREPRGRERRGPPGGMGAGPAPMGMGPGSGGPGGGRRGFEEGLDKGRGPSSARYPDSHQLFVGNLPQDINDEELKAFFSG